MGYSSRLDKGDHPETDMSEFLDDKEMRIYQSLIGSLQWAVSLASFDIASAVMTLLSFRAPPRRGHLERAKRVSGYLYKFKHTGLKCSQFGILPCPPGPNPKSKLNHLSLLLVSRWLHHWETNNELYEVEKRTMIVQELVVLALVTNTASGLAPIEPPSSRREALKQVVSGSLAATALLLQPRVAHAFDNKISNKYDDRPKRRGPQPKDLGVSTRVNLEGDEYVGLKSCGAAPNCFCSTMTVEDDPDHSIPSWKWPATYDQKRALDELHAVIQAYLPGQNGVDGGGFAVKTFDPNKGYMYVQFESLKNGYIDDFEAAVIPEAEKGGAVQVRSSSRIGYLDFGVNAKRLNYIAKELRSKGWDAEGVDLVKAHRGYAIENQL